MVIRGIFVGAIFVGIAAGFAGCSDEPGGLDAGTNPTSTNTTPTSTGTTTSRPDSSTPVPDSSVADTSVADTSVADSSTADASDGATAPTFTQIYDDIINNAGLGAQRCNSCHGNNGSSGLSMNTKAAAYANLVTNGTTANCGAVTKRVTPNNTAQSSMFLKTSAAPPANCGTRMPRGQNPLNAAQIKMIQDWINAGALNN